MKHMKSVKFFVVQASSLLGPGCRLEACTTIYFLFAYFVVLNICVYPCFFSG